MILFPAIDLKDGKCVRLKHGDMATATIYNDDPAAQALAFEKQGFEWLHVVDLNGAFEGRASTARRSAPSSRLRKIRSAWRRHPVWRRSRTGSTVGLRASFSAPWPCAIGSGPAGLQGVPGQDRRRHRRQKRQWRSRLGEAPASASSWRGRGRGRRRHHLHRHRPRRHADQHQLGGDRNLAEAVSSVIASGSSARSPTSCA